MTKNSNQARAIPTRPISDPVRRFVPRWMAIGSSASCCSARSGARLDSDYDVAIGLEEPGELWKEFGRLSYITPTILADLLEGRGYDMEREDSTLRGTDREHGRTTLAALMAARGEKQLAWTMNSRYASST